MSDLFSYAAKKVVLTGGSSGVGAAALELIVDAGCSDVTVLDRNEPTGPATAFIPTDMSDPASIDAAVDEIGAGVDVLFNNAGVAGTHPSDFVVKVNYLGVRRLSEASSQEWSKVAPSSTRHRSPARDGPNTWPRYPNSSP